MNSLNLRNLLLTGSAIILMGFIIVFPVYFTLAIIDDESITALLLIIFAITSSVIAGRIHQDTFSTTILKLSLFTFTYILMMATLLNYEHRFTYDIFPITASLSACFSICTAYFFRNPYIRIVLFTFALITLILCLTDIFHFIKLINGEVINIIMIVYLIILIIISLSKQALRYYTFIIALTLALMFSPIWQSYDWLNITASIIIIAIGFYLQSRTLHLLGILFFGFALFFYYYNLESSLSTKGIILMSTGIVILIARYAFHYFEKIRHEN